MGEIGIPHHTALYDLRFWHIQQAIYGNNRRHRDLWSSVRWQTFYLMAAQCGENLQKSGIHSPTDLIQFPWDLTNDDDDTTAAGQPSAAEVKALRELMRQENAAAIKKETPDQ